MSILDSKGSIIEVSICRTCTTKKMCNTDLSYPIIILPFTVFSCTHCAQHSQKQDGVKNVKVLNNLRFLYHAQQSHKWADGESVNTINNESHFLFKCFVFSLGS